MFPRSCPSAALGNNGGRRRATTSSSMLRASCFYTIVPLRRLGTIAAGGGLRTNVVIVMKSRFLCNCPSAGLGDNGGRRRGPIGLPGRALGPRGIPKGTQKGPIRQSGRALGPKGWAHKGPCGHHISPYGSYICSPLTFEETRFGEPCVVQNPFLLGLSFGH